MRFIEGAKSAGRTALHVSPFGLLVAGFVVAESMRPNPNPGYDSELESCNVPALTRLGTHDSIKRKMGDKVLVAGIDVEIRSGGQILVDERKLNKDVWFDNQGDLNIKAKGRITEVVGTALSGEFDTKLDVYCQIAREEKIKPTPTPEPVQEPIPNPEVELAPVS